MPRTCIFFASVSVLVCVWLCGDKNWFWIN